MPGIRRILLNWPETNSRSKYDWFLRSYPCVAQTVYRDNRLQDIGAYDDFYRQLKVTVTPVTSCSQTPPCAARERMGG